MQNRLQQCGIVCKTLNFGEAGQFYFHTTYGDLGESEEDLVLKLGFARSSDSVSLSAVELLRSKLLSPRAVAVDELRGNAILICLSKVQPEFLIYKTLLAPQPLCFTEVMGEILCSTSQRCLLHLLDEVVLNEDVLPYHFIFQFVPGHLTYYRNVRRLFPGQRLHWHAGRLDVKRVRDLRFQDARQVKRLDKHAADRVYDVIKAVVGSYIGDVSRSGHRVASLLSGGVDSGIVQVIVNACHANPDQRPPSFSYRVIVPGFDIEDQYARQASKMLKTQHSTCPIRPEDLPGIIERTTEAVAQPIPHEADACKFALAEFLAAHDTSRYFLSGQVADGLYGLGLARKIAIYELVKNVPAARHVAAFLAKVVKPGSARVASGLKDLAVAMTATDDPADFNHWLNSLGIFMDLAIARRSFGDESIRNVQAHRRELEHQYLDSNNLTEKLHAAELITMSYEPAEFGTQIFLSQKKQLICPYADEDIIRNAHSFAPAIRFVKPGFGFWRRDNTKHLLKTILVNRSYGDIALKAKGGSSFDADLFVMMKKGALTDMTQAIERPSFLSRADFEALLRKPDYFLWSLLTFDTFKKRVLSR
ncbi:asparagine synthase-related protein [Pseudomonadota bacterium]